MSTAAAERRRRIAERGSDRLALITGRIHSLPNPNDSRQSENNNIVLNEPSLPVNEHGGTHIVSRAVSLLGAQNEFSQTLSSLQNLNQRHSHNDNDNNNNNNNNNNDSNNSSSNNDLPLTGHTTITKGQIRSAITASENIRMFCAIAAAFIALFSYTGFPILGWGVIRGVLLFRPLYLLLLTNVSVAVARLVLGKQSRVLRARQTSGVPIFGGNTFDQLGQALEVGLLMQSIFGALFIDFSVYAVVLVCGFSMLRSLGW